MGQAQYLLRARLAGKLISLWNFDLPHIAQVSDIGPALPVNLWLLRLRCLWCLRRCRNGESQRQENREKQGFAPLIEHNLHLVECSQHFEAYLHVWQ